jgi:hypothetical protein
VRRTVKDRRSFTPPWVGGRSFIKWLTQFCDISVMTLIKKEVEMHTYGITCHSCLPQSAHLCFSEWPCFLPCPLSLSHTQLHGWRSSQGLHAVKICSSPLNYGHHCTCICFMLNLFPHHMFWFLLGYPFLLRKPLLWSVNNMVIGSVGISWCG